MSQRLTDFSSLGPDEEQRFVPFESAMRDNGRRAALIGLAFAGALLALILIVCLGLYSPCNAFCSRSPPGSCRTPEQKRAWQESCETSCRGLERERGSDYVEMLNACNFSNGAGSTCALVVEQATARGLWCK